MRLNRWLALAGLLLLLQPRTAAAALPPPEIRWMGRLPGVMLIRTAPQPGQQTWTYHVSRTAATFNRIAAGFARRGWRLQMGTDLEDARGSIRSLTARSGDRVVGVNIRNGATLDGWMTVGVAYGSAGLPASIATTGYATVVNGDAIHQTVTGHGGSIVVNGHDNGIIVLGACSVLSVNGTDNQVTVRGTVRRIEMGGKLNEVRWSRASNAIPPVVVRHGIANDVIATP